MDILPKMVYITPNQGAKMKPQPIEAYVLLFSIATAIITQAGLICFWLAFGKKINATYCRIKPWLWATYNDIVNYIRLWLWNAYEDYIRFPTLDAIEEILNAINAIIADWAKYANKIKEGRPENNELTTKHSVSFRGGEYSD